MQVFYGALNVHVLNKCSIIVDMPPGVYVCVTV